MRKGLVGFVLVVPLLSSLASASPIGQDSSEIIYPRSPRSPRSQASAAPVWLSAEAATAPGGEIDWSLLGDRAWMIYRSVVENEPLYFVAAPGEKPEIDPDSSGMHPECAYYGAAHFDSVDAPPAESLADAAERAQAVLQGRIVALTAGFYLGEPNTLLTVQVEQRVRASKAFPESATFYVVYPKARFGIGTIKFCKNDSKFKAVPAVGDQVRLTPLHGPQGKEGLLIQPGPYEIVFLQDARGSSR